MPVAEARELPVEDGRHDVGFGIEEEVTAPVVAVNEGNGVGWRRILLEPIERHLNHRMIVDGIVVPHAPPPGDHAIRCFLRLRLWSLERDEARYAKILREMMNAGEI